MYLRSVAELCLVVCYPRCLDDLEALVLLSGGLYLLVEVGSLLHEPCYLLLCVNLNLCELVTHYAHLLGDLLLLCLELFNLNRQSIINNERLY